MKTLISIILTALIIICFIVIVYMNYFIYGDVVLTPIDKIKAYWIPDVILLVSYIGLLATQKFMKRY